MNNKLISATNVLFIIGNGFDLNMGLKTSYKNFLQWYNNLDSNKDAAVQKLKEYLRNILDEVEKNNDKKNNWVDLELELGKATSIYSKCEDFYRAYCDIGENLASYLTLEERKYHDAETNRQKAIAHDFIDDVLIFIVNNGLHVEQTVNINFITFNYTLSLDWIIERIKNDNSLLSELKNKNIVFNSPHHCHGSLQTGKICLGVNDYSQIANTTMFSDHRRYMEQMIKPMRNDYLKNKDATTSIQLINKADEIIIYGCSLGETDKYWIDKLKLYLGGKEMSYTHGSIIQFPEKIELRNNNNKLYYYSHEKKPESMFDADGIEFEDRIRKNISFEDDTRIKIIYKNVFNSMRDSL